MSSDDHSSADDTDFAGGSQDLVVREQNDEDGDFDVDTTNCVHKLHGEAIFCSALKRLDLNKDLSVDLLFTGGQDDLMKVFYAETMELLAEVKFLDSVIAVEFRDDNLLVGAMNGDIKIYRFGVKRSFFNEMNNNSFDVELLKRHFDMAVLQELTADTSIEWVIWHPQMKSVVVAGLKDWTLEYWHIETGQFKLLRSPDTNAAFFGLHNRDRVDIKSKNPENKPAADYLPPMCIEFLDNLRCVIGYGDGNLIIWDMKRLAVVSRLYTFGNTGVSVIRKVDGNVIVVGCSCGPTALYLFNTNKASPKIGTYKNNAFQEEAHIGDIILNKNRTLITCYSNTVHDGESFKSSLDTASRLLQFDAVRYNMLFAKEFVCEMTNMVSFDDTKVFLSFTSGDIFIFDISTFSTIMVIKPFEYDIFCMSVANVNEFADMILMAGSDSGELLLLNIKQILGQVERAQQNNQQYNNNHNNGWVIRE